MLLSGCTALSLQFPLWQTAVCCLRDAGGVPMGPCAAVLDVPVSQETVKLSCQRGDLEACGG